MCLIKLRLLTKSRTDVSFRTRSYKYFNATQYQEDLKSINWDFIETEDSVDVIWEKWHGKLCEALDKHAPYKVIRQDNKKNNPWMNKELNDLIRKKMAARVAKDNWLCPATVNNFNILKQLKINTWAQHIFAIYAVYALLFGGPS